MSNAASFSLAACTLAIGLASLAPLASGQQPTLQRLHRALPADSYTSYVFATGDVDGDGDADLVIGRWAPFSPSKVLLNDGNGAFAELAGAWTSSARATALALGDVDGDGDLDIVEGSDGPEGLYLNDGTGRFYDVSYQLPPSLDQTTDIALFDADLDGDLDIALARYDGQNRLVWNLGAGAFAESPAGLPGAQGFSRSIAVGDVDGDLDDDLLIGAESYYGWGAPPRLVLNQGGTFVEAPFPVTLFETNGPVVLFDVDQDQDLDAVVGLSTGSELMINNGAGVFASAGTLPNPGAHPWDEVRSLVAGDVDGDGDLDLAMGYLGGSNEQGSVLYVNDGTGGFAVSAGFPELLGVGRFALLDVDGDQDLDAVHDAHVLLLNDGNGGFVRTDALEADHKMLYETERIAIADADGDGDVDLFASNSGVWTNEHGTFVLNASAPPLVGRLLDVGDLDGDGDVDVLAGYSEVSRMLLGDGAGGFADASAMLPFMTSSSIQDLDLGDLDGDGDLDALACAEPGGLLLRNAGGAKFVDDSGVLPAFGVEYEQLLVDVDLDGDLDLLRGTEHALYRNDGLGLFTLAAGALPATSEPTWTMDAGDVDGDGDVDLVWGFLELTHDRLYKNSGAGTFFDATPAGLLFVAEPTASLRLADLDGDGDLDLYQGLAPGHQTYFDPVLGYSYPVTVTGGADRVYLNPGQGNLVLADSMVAPHNGWTSDIEVADVDGDGDIDVLAAGGGWFSLSGGLLRNTTRQVAWRTVPRVGKPLAMDVYGPPLSPWFLAASVHTTSVPIGAFGVLGIDPTTLFVTVGGMLDVEGRATAGFAVPATLPLVGASAYWQGLVGSPQLRFTNVERTTFTDL